MFSSNWFLVPFFAQGSVLATDEFLFHSRRGLGRFESWGHGVDTLSFAVPIAVASFFPLTSQSAAIYLGLAVFSSLLVTKDEWVHAKECKASEHWLHSVLFLLHPVCFWSGYELWQRGEAGSLHVFLWVSIAAFFYQIIRWVVFGALRAPAPLIDNGLYDRLGSRWYEAYDDPVALLRAESQLKSPWIEKRVGQKVLDIGCGGGFLSNYLAQKGRVVTGVDLSEESLAVARAHDATGTVQYLKADAYSLPFSDGSFDSVTMMDFLEHVDNPQKAIAEASRVLRPGGVFIFHTFNRNWLSYLLVIRAVEFFVKNTPPHMHVYRLFLKPIEVEDACRAAGLRVTEATGIRPKLWRFSVLKGLFTGVVPRDFSFEFCRSRLVSYAGVAVKN